MQSGWSDGLAGGALSPAQDPLPLGGGWQLWRTVCLRSAGFPIALLDTVASPELLAASDSAQAARDAHAGALDELVQIARDRMQSAPDAERGTWRRAIARVYKTGRANGLGSGRSDEALARTAAALDAAAVARDSREGELAGAFERASAHALHALGAAWTDDRLREALAWQNPDAPERILDAWRASGAGVRNKQARRRELLLARYLARYCAKNESIGFFGPVGWGAIRPDVPGIVADRPETLTDRCRVSFEHWAIAALADALFAPPEARVWLTPRIAPGIALEAGAVRDARGRVVAVPPDRVAVLARCDGLAPAGRIALELGSGSRRVFGEPRLVLGCLAELARAGAVRWEPAIPVGPDPERRLRALVGSVGNAPLRERMLRTLDEIGALRDAAQAATGNSRAVAAALGALDTRFEAATGRESRRLAGHTYAGRTPLYLDCRRAGELRIGDDVFRRLGPALVVVLDSAYWFAAQTTERLDAFVAAQLASEQATTPSAPVPVERLLERLTRDRSAVAALRDGTVADLQARWAELLEAANGRAESDVGAGEAGAGRGGADAGGAGGQRPRRIRLLTRRIGARAAELFACADARWPDGRIQSPDLMIAAADEAAIAAGRFLAVLGEIHLAAPTALQPALLALNPDAASLLADLQRARPEPRLTHAYSGRSPGLRTAFDYATPHDFHVEQADARSWRSPGQVVPMSALVAREEGGSVVVRTRDGALRFPGAAYFREALRALFRDAFAILPPTPHRPRIALDDLVVAREQWRLGVADCAFAFSASALERFRGLDALARRLGWPRRAFYRVGAEQKPFLLDRANPLSIDDFAHQVRAADGPEAPIVVSEMLPAPDGCWLADASDRRYTCELRLTAVRPDAKAGRAAG